MRSWFLTEEDKKKYGEIMENFKRKYPHYEEDAQYRMLKRIFELLVIRESQAESMSRGFFDQHNYNRFKESIDYLKRMTGVVLNNSFQIKEEILKFDYHLISQTLNCSSSNLISLNSRYLSDLRDYYANINEFQGFADILHLAMDWDLGYEEYYYLAHSYEIYQTELTLALIFQRNSDNHEDFVLKQNPFDVLLHQMRLVQRDDGVFDCFDLACSYGEEALSLVIDRCEQELHSKQPKKDYVPLIKTLRLSMDAKERGKKNE